jgi:hypothetical protein
MYGMAEEAKKECQVQLDPLRVHIFLEASDVANKLRLYKNTCRTKPQTTDELLMAEKNDKNNLVRMYRLVFVKCCIETADQCFDEMLNLDTEPTSQSNDQLEHPRD